RAWPTSTGSTPTWCRRLRRTSPRTWRAQPSSSTRPRTSSTPSAPRSCTSSSPRPVASGGPSASARRNGGGSPPGRPAGRAQGAALPLVSAVEGVVHPRALGPVGGGDLGAEQAGETGVIEHLLHQHHLGPAVGAEGGPERRLHAQEPGLREERGVGPAGHLDV